MTLDPFAMLAEAVRAQAQPWRQDAACRGLPTSWFYPEQGQKLDPRAAAACDQCTVREQCWEDGKVEQYGVWAGETLKVRKLNKGPQPIKHGTDGGYTAHRRRGEDACSECKRAHAQKTAIQQRPRGQADRQSGEGWGLTLTGTFGRRRLIDEGAA
jgi:hypothetical protein